MTLTKDFNFLLKSERSIKIIIICFILFKLISLAFYDNFWWDSSVYIGIGKYIYSGSDAGLFEDSRPLVWPLLLGFLWKMKLPLISARILEIIFGSLCIFLVYKIGNKLFDRKTAALASFLIAISPTFFFFSGILLSEIASTLFSLIAVYYFIDKKYFSCGLFFGIAFMTRYLQLLVFLAVFLYLIIYSNKIKIRNSINIVFGFLISTISFLIYNYLEYSNILFSFLQQANLTANSGWFNHHYVGFYFIELFKDNFAYLLFIIGLYLVFRNKEKSIIGIIFMILFVFFNLIRQKEMRFLIILLPYMYLLISYAMINAFESKNDIIKDLVIFSLLMIISFNSLNIIYSYKNQQKNPYETLQQRFEAASGRLWISNPVISVYSDKKVDELMYYPYFTREKKDYLVKNYGMADFVFLDTCDLACKPSDTFCERNKKDMVEFFKQKFDIKYQSSGKCEQYIFRKSIS